jgi:hypothetical protein
MIDPRACDLLCTAVLCLGCETVVSGFRKIPMIGTVGTSGGITEEELHLEVLGAANRFSVGVSAAADSIALGARDRPTRRNTLLWKIRMIPLATRASVLPKASEGLLALFTLATAQRRYLVEGEGRALFGEQQEVARSAAQVIERDIRRRSRVLPAGDAGRLNSQVEQLASDNPIRGAFMFDDPQRLYRREVDGDVRLVSHPPLARSGVFQGVESGAAAIHDSTPRRDSSGDIATALPRSFAGARAVPLRYRGSRYRGFRAGSVREDRRRLAGALDSGRGPPGATRRELEITSQ